MSLQRKYIQKYLNYPPNVIQQIPLFTESKLLQCLITKKYFKNKYPLNQKASKILPINTISTKNVILTMATAPTLIK